MGIVRKQIIDQPVEPNYCRPLGLTSAPFSGSHEDHEAYLYPELEQRLDLLQHLAEYGDRLLLILGEPGSGKSALLQEFLARAREHWLTCVVQGTDQLSNGALLRGLVQCLEAEAAGNSADDLLEGLAQRLRALQLDCQIAILLIDDAHLLRPETLSGLLTLLQTNADAGSLFRVLLFAEPSIKPTLYSGKREYSQQLTFSLDLPTLNRLQTEGFILQQLAEVGYQGATPFSAAQMDAIYASSAGLPGPALALAHDTLSRIYPDQTTTTPPNKRSSKRRFTPFSVAASVIVTLLIGTLLAFQDRINALLSTAPAPRSNEAPGAAHETADDSVAELPTLSRFDDELASGSEDLLAAGDSVGDELPSTESAPVEAPIERQLPQETVARPANETQERTKEPTIFDGPPPKPPEPTIIAGPLPASAENLVAVTSLPELRAPEPPALANDDAPQTLDAKPIPDTNRDAEIEPPLPPEEPPSRDDSLSAPPPLALREDWLLQQSPTHYTVQLLAMREEESITRFINRHQLQGPLAYFRTRRDGGNWYALVSGAFAERQSAVTASQELSTALRVKPWLRSFRAVQRDIQRSRPAGD